MTVIEALRKSIETLNGVAVPVSMIQQVGMPISGAVGLIQASVDALERNELEQTQKAQETDGEAEEEFIEEPEEEPEEEADG